MLTPNRCHQRHPHNGVGTLNPEPQTPSPDSEHREAIAMLIAGPRPRTLGTHLGRLARAAADHAGLLVGVALVAMGVAIGWVLCLAVKGGG